MDQKDDTLLPNSMQNPAHTPLKLQAEDHEDLHFLSAHVQDALIPVSSLRFHDGDKRFHLSLNRFRWELEQELHEGESLFYRTHCELSFGHIKQVHHRGFEASHPTHILYLLSIRGHEDGTITFHCSDDASIRLQADKIFCRLADKGDHWPTKAKPIHEEAA